MNGKGAMVWRLRDWADGTPDGQVADALALGLSHVSLKIIDGTNERWENFWVRPQNQDLLPELVPALREAGIKVKGWGWTYGYDEQREAERTIEVCDRYGITEYDIDAEHQYNKPGMEGKVETYAGTLAGAVPEIRVGLCSYRFPLRYQPDFPVEAFAPFMDYWCPQVYFLGDNRTHGGASQLEISHNEYMGIRRLPYQGVAPTYDWNGWRATPGQLLQFFQKAKDLGHEGFMVWDLPQASPEQWQAIEQFDWPVDEPPSQPNVKDRLIGVRDELDDIIGEL